METSVIDNRELLEYSKAIVDTSMKLEDRAVLLAIQNYAASGAVFLALYKTKMPPWIAAAVITLITVNMTLTIIYGDYPFDAGAGLIARQGCSLQRS